MHSKTTANFPKRLAALPTDVQNRAAEAYRRFQTDPFHQSLRFKQVHPSLPFYSVRISKGYRAVGQREGSVVIWFWIGTHTEYERLLDRR